MSDTKESTSVTNTAFDPALFEKVFQIKTDEATGVTSALFFAFNTLVTLKALAEASLCVSVFKELNAQCRRYESLFSRHISTSDLARLNGAQGKEREIDESTAELLEAACFYCAESEGVFDISVAPALRLWDFMQGGIPEEKELACVLPHINWKMLRLRSEDASAAHPARFFACLADPDSAIDVGGIAKGYIADKLAGHLNEHGIENYIINLGGNVVVRGMRPDETPWKVGIQDPRQQKVLRTIDVMDASAVTSGTYERGFKKDGVLYHHIIDPKTGWPVETDVAGVTVVSKRSLDAEGYSTTLLALGIERGCDFARKRKEILAAYFVDNSGRVVCCGSD